MKTIYMSILCAGLINVQAYAQNTQVTTEQAIDAELKTAEGAAKATLKDVGQYPNVVILNQNSSKNKNDSEAENVALAEAQNLPTTYVEASPLSESRVNQLRSLRQNAEIDTEQKIVEKLEASRLEDERRRANALFGDRFNSINQKQQAQPVAPPAPIAQPAPAPPVAPAAPVVPETVHIIRYDEPKTTAEQDIEEEVEAAESKSSTKLADYMPKGMNQKQNLYISGSLGGLSYSASNIDTQYSVGGAIGIDTKSKVSFELGFNYSNHIISEFYSQYSEMDQYNFSGMVKYSLLDKGSRINPYVGGLATYVRRNYTDFALYRTNNFGRRSSNGFTRFNTGGGDITTNSFEVGAAVGVDFKLSDNFSIGADYRYSTNIINQDNPDYLLFFNESPVEEIDYSQFAITGKITF